VRIERAALQAALEKGIRRDALAGVSVAVLHGGSVTTAAAGMANVASSVEMTPDTLMHIGSITKVFNATLVMQLVDEGRVDLNERVVRYLPELMLAERDALERITVQMLLNHTSGIDGDILPDQGHDEETIEKGVSRFAQLRQKFAPGSEFSYCNAATVIAGHLVQRLTGKSWYTLVRERIFAPLRMKHAATLPEEAILQRAAVGHFLDASRRAPVRTSCAFLPLSFAPCGTTLMMSAADLISFARAHIDGPGILSERSTRAMQEVTVDNRGKGYTYIDAGIGWMVTRDGMLFHAGGGPGIASVLYVFPKRGFAAAVLTNAPHSLTLINELVKPWLEELGGPLPFGVADVRVPRAVEPVDPTRYVGVYEDILHRFHVASAINGLTLSRQAKLAYYDNVSIEPAPPARLLPLSEHQFLLDTDGPDAFRIFTFRNQHLGHLSQLYRKA
jgi:CubicO group peptidase (beta-lactamase class C family)